MKSLDLIIGLAVVLAAILSGLLINPENRLILGIGMSIFTGLMSAFIINQRATNRTGRRTGTRLHRNILVLSLVLLLLARVVYYFDPGFLIYGLFSSIGLLVLLLTIRLVAKFENKKPFLARNAFLLLLIPGLAIAGHFLLIKGLDEIGEHILVLFGELLSVLLILTAINRWGVSSNFSFTLVLIGAILFILSLFIHSVNSFSELVTLPGRLSRFVEHLAYFSGTFLLVFGISEQIKDKILNVKYFKDQKEENPFQEIL